MDEIDKKDHNCLHSATGIRKMRKAKGRERLDKRIENEMAFKSIVQIITFGLGVISTSVIKSASLYLVRDYPAVVDFVQDRKDYFGTIMVPEILIPGAPRIFDPHLSQSVLDQLSGGKDKKKYNKLKGELTRHNVPFHHRKRSFSGNFFPAAGTFFFRGWPLHPRVAFASRAKRGG